MATYNDISPSLNEKQPYDVEVTRNDTALSKASARDLQLKRRIRIMRIVQRALNMIMSAVVLGIMLNTYITFTNNRTQNVNGQIIPIYPTDPITWPTFMMIATGAVSFIFSTCIIFAYIKGVSSANRMTIYQGYWGYLVMIINVVVWLTTTTTFMMVQGDPSEVPPPRDLWGWTCSDAVDKLSSEIKTKVNFDLQCTTQQVSFAMGIINASVEMFGLVISGFALYRMMHKKKIQYLERQQSGR